MEILRDLNPLHPILRDYVNKIQKEVIDAHNIPIRLFETGRLPERHKFLISKGKSRDLMSGHLFNLGNKPPQYAIAVDYVFYDSKWSWNLRDSTTNSWYILFGNLVLDLCPKLQWLGMNRKSVNFCHFQLKRDVLIDNLKIYPCVI